MKIEIIVSSRGLLDKLKAVGKVINQKSLTPAFGYFHFETKNGQLILTAADNEGLISTDVEVYKAEGEGVFLVEHKILLDGLKELPEEPITISADTESCRISIRHEHGTFNMMGINPDDFVTMKNNDEEPPIEMSVESHIMVEGVKTVLPFSANDELRPVMCTVFVECRNGQLNFVASNANYLALQETREVSFPDFEMLLSPKTGKIIAELADGADMINMKLGSRTLSAKFGDYRIISRLVEGCYPNYRGVIPTGNEKKIEVDKKELISSLKRVSIFTNKGSSLIKLNAKPGQLTISGRDDDFSQSAQETLNCTYEKEDLNIGFKAEFLRQCLETIYSDEVKITMSDSTRPALFLPVDNDPGTTSLTVLLMPMLINV